MKYFLLIFFSLMTSQIGFAQRYLTDKKNGCKVWTSSNSQDLSMSWSGSCNHGLSEGEGTLIWFIKGKEVARYTGSMRKGLPNGNGIATTSEGRTTRGNYSDGEIIDLDSLSLEKLQKNLIQLSNNTLIFDNFLPDKSLFYYALLPKTTVKGALVLFPGTWERPESVLSNNKKLCQLAREEGLVVIVPSTNMHIFLDQPVITFINTVFDDAVNRYSISKDKIVLGGFSLGGIVSLRYTELAYENRAAVSIVPAAAYSVDGPVDFSNMYRQFEREIEKNLSPVAVNEAKYYIDGMRKSFGGSPSQNPDNFLKFSVYSRSEKDGGNARFLKTVPLRIYSDPDVDWAMKNRMRDLYDMNAPDQTAIIIELNLQGNKDAEYINALGKGYRFDGTRHPHSWSLVDPEECLRWIKKCLKL